MLNPVAIAAVVTAELTLGASRPVVPAHMVVDLRVYTYSRIDPERTEEARRMAQALLSAAGVESTWRLCGRHDDGCGEPAANARIVLIHVVAVRNEAKPSISGDAMTASSALPMVHVYLPRIAELVEKFRRTGPQRGLPELSTLTTGQLVALTIAHEVGHSLGLRHGRAGIMRAKLGAEDVAAARRLTLAFQPAERERMLVALQASERTLASDVRVP